jgi:hypothetical protein
LCVCIALFLLSCNHTDDSSTTVQYYTQGDPTSDGAIIEREAKSSAAKTKQLAVEASAQGKAGAIEAQGKASNLVDQTKAGLEQTKERASQYAVSVVSNSIILKAKLIWLVLYPALAHLAVCDIVDVSLTLSARLTKSATGRLRLRWTTVVLRLIKLMPSATKLMCRPRKQRPRRTRKRWKPNQAGGPGSVGVHRSKAGREDRRRPWSVIQSRRGPMPNIPMYLINSVPT